MKTFHLFLLLSILKISSALAQHSTTDKAFADSLVNEWNVRFNSDKPDQFREILSEAVNEISGDNGNYSRDSVMENFVKKRMPVISELKAVNEFFSVSKDMVYTAGGYMLKVTKSEQESYIAEGNYTLVWTRQKDNKFRVEFIHIESIPKK